MSREPLIFIIRAQLATLWAQKLHQRLVNWIDQKGWAFKNSLPLMIFPLTL